MSNSTTKTRKQIIDECATAATACFNHYSDHQLSNETRFEVEKALDRMLPDQIATDGWQEYSRLYQSRVEAEAKEND